MGNQGRSNSSMQSEYTYKKHLYKTLLRFIGNEDLSKLI